MYKILDMNTRRYYSAGLQRATRNGKAWASESALKSAIINRFIRYELPLDVLYGFVRDMAVENIATQEIIPLYEYIVNNVLSPRKTYCICQSCNEVIVLSHNRICNRCMEEDR